MVVELRQQAHRAAQCDKMSTNFADGSAIVLAHPGLDGAPAPRDGRTSLRHSVAIDGSKFKAVNNRDKNFTRAKMERRKAQIEESEPTTPEPRPLVAIERATGSVSDICESRQSSCDRVRRALS